jgi:hypothetical protein
VSKARNAIDSTFRRILSYTAEIIMSIILLVIICIPLAFTIPVWFQYILLDTPRTEFTINLVAWFGYDGAFLITLLLGLVSFSLSYVYILKMKPGITSVSGETEVDEEIDSLEDEDEIAADEDVEEETAAEDQEEDEIVPVDLDEMEANLEDIEDDEEESEDDD